MCIPQGMFKSGDAGSWQAFVHEDPFRAKV